MSSSLWSEPEGKIVLAALSEFVRLCNKWKFTNQDIDYDLSEMDTIEKKDEFIKNAFELIEKYRTCQPVAKIIWGLLFSYFQAMDLVVGYGDPCPNSFYSSRYFYYVGTIKYGTKLRTPQGNIVMDTLFQTQSEYTRFGA